MTIKIVQKEADVLREKAVAVSRKEIVGDEIQEIITHMKKALRSRDDGVALAAPQIGVAKQIFIVSPKIFGDHIDKHSRELVFINPTISQRSKKEELLEEGCLSVHGIYGRVSRAKHVTLEALNEESKKVKIDADGLLAQIFQHEVDHLHGILFIDKAVEFFDVPQQE